MDENIYQQRTLLRQCCTGEIASLNFWNRHSSFFQSSHHLFLYLCSTKFMKKVILSLFLVIGCLSICSSQTQDTADSILKLKDSKRKVDELLLISKSLFSSDHEKALELATSARKSSVRLKYKSGEAKALNEMGVAIDYSGDAVLANKYLDSALMLYKALRDDEGTGRAIQDKGISYLYAGKTEKAIEYLLEAIPYHKKAGNDKGVASALNNLGILARSSGNYQQALDYYQQSIKYKKRLNDSVGLSNTYTNIGVIYQKLEDWEKAYTNALLSEKYGKALPNKSELYISKINSAICLKNLKRRTEAKILFEEIRDYFKKEGDELNYAIALSNLSGLYGDMGNWDAAEVALLKTIKLLEKYGRTEMQLEVYQNLSDLYLMKEDTTRAFIYLSKLTKLKDSTNYQKVSADVKELESKYKYQAQKEEIESLNKDAEINTLRIKQAAINQWLLIIGIILSSGIVVYVWYNLRKNKSHNTAISKALADKELLLKEIHHRVKNNLQTVSGLLYLQSDYIEDDSALNAIEESRTRVEAMAIIHQKLYKENDLLGVSTIDYVNDLIDGIFDVLNIEDEAISIKKNIEDLSLDVDTTIPMGLILNELITNTLKHAFPSDQDFKEIEIDLKIEEGLLLMRVKDNGQGKKVSQRYSTGFGTKMIDMFCKKLNASISKKTDNGYSVELQIRNFKLSA